MGDISGAAAKTQSYLLPKAYLRRIPSHVFWNQFNSRDLTGIYVVPVTDFYTPLRRSVGGKGGVDPTTAYRGWLAENGAKARLFKRYSLKQPEGGMFGDYVAVRRHRNDLHVILNLGKLYGPDTTDKRFYAMLHQLREALDAARQQSDWPKGRHPQEVVRIVFEQAPQPAHLSLTEYAGPSLAGRNSTLIVPDLRMKVGFHLLSPAEVEISEEPGKQIPPGQDNSQTVWFYSPLGIIDTTVVQLNPRNGSLYFADCAYDFNYHKSFPEARNSHFISERTGINFFNSLCELNVDTAQYLSFRADTVPALIKMTYDDRVKDVESWYSLSPKTSFTRAQNWQELTANMTDPSSRVKARAFYIWPAVVTAEIRYYLNGKKGYTRLGSTLLDVLRNEGGLADLQSARLKRVRVERSSPGGYTRVHFGKNQDLHAAFRQFYLKAGDKIYTDESL
ncbi:hypothetical protein GCM10027348_38770 [Hymenobacter tenuis]